METAKDLAVMQTMLNIIYMNLSWLNINS